VTSQIKGYVEHDMTTACRKGKLEQVYINYKCGQS